MNLISRIHDALIPPLCRAVAVLMALATLATAANIIAGAF
jgi:hypothetical protein